MSFEIKDNKNTPFCKECGRNGGRFWQLAWANYTIVVSCIQLLKLLNISLDLQVQYNKNKTKNKIIKKTVSNKIIERKIRLTLPSKKKKRLTFDRNEQQRESKSPAQRWRERYLPNELWESP